MQEIFDVVMAQNDHCSKITGAYILFSVWRNVQNLQLNLISHNETFNNWSNIMLSTTQGCVANLVMFDEFYEDWSHVCS